MWKQLYSNGDHQGDKRQSLNAISKLFLVVTPQNIIISFGGFPEALNGNYFEGKKINDNMPVLASAAYTQKL